MIGSLSGIPPSVLGQPLISESDVERRRIIHNQISNNTCRPAEGFFCEHALDLPLLMQVCVGFTLTYGFSSEFLPERRSRHEFESKSTLFTVMVRFIRIRLLVVDPVELSFITCAFVYKVERRTAYHFSTVLCTPCDPRGPNPGKYMVIT